MVRKTHPEPVDPATEFLAVVSFLKARSLPVRPARGCPADRQNRLRCSHG